MWNHYVDFCYSELISSASATVKKKAIDILIQGEDINRNQSGPHMSFWDPSCKRNLYNDKKRLSTLCWLAQGKSLS